MKTPKAIKSRKQQPRRREKATAKPKVRLFHKVAMSLYAVAILWTTITHAAVFNISKAAGPVDIAHLRLDAMPSSNLRGRFAIRSYVESAAKAQGVSPRVADWIVTHESQHHPDAIGDGGQSRGLWQINKEWHPEVSDACAYDVKCSTRWSLDRIRDGYADEWSTWKYCRAWYGDCPF